MTGTPPADRTLTRAGFLIGALAFTALIALSIVGIGHSRQIRGAANPEFWIVVALVAAAATAMIVGLALQPERSALRVAVVALAAIGVALFVWETTALGLGLSPSPSGLIGAALGF